LSQYWRRAVRTGHAYAEISARYRDTADPLWAKESRANFLRGSLYILLLAVICSAAAVTRSWIPLLAGLAAGAALSIRSALRWRWKNVSWKTLLLFGVHSHVQHVPILQGQILYLWRKWRGQGRLLIEYKKPS